jgi:hypothetical protein
MSTGGVFKLITNSGIQDKLLMATDYLNSRIKEMSKRNIEKYRKTYGSGINLDDSWIPDINAIDKSHAIFINGSFKPFVASGFEYVKLINSTGTKGFGGDTTFTLPQFGDFINDVVVHVRLNGLAAINNQDRVRYVSMLGHKLFSKVEFKVNHNILDAYDSNDYNAYYDFKVPASKKIGWLRNIGQEIPNRALLTADPTYDMVQEYKWFGDGNQTFKQKHDAIDLWIPLLFWFKDIKNALPSVMIPHGQSNITITIPPVSEIIGFANYSNTTITPIYTPPTITTMELYVNNIFMNPEIVKIFVSKFGFSLIRVHGHHTENNITTNSAEIKLNGLKWPTETMYVSFKPQSNNNLSQYWHKNSQLTLNKVRVPVVVRNLNLITTGTIGTQTFPITNAVSLVRVAGPGFGTSVDGTFNGYDLVLTGGPGFNTDDIVQNRYTVSTYVAVNNVFNIVGVWRGTTPTSATTFSLFTPQVGINSSQYYKETPSIDSIEIKAHGIVIFRDTHESFYNSYLPTRFGERMNTPEDRGWYMINFNYYPGDHQPSGHINLSRAREFYIKYTSSFIGNTNPTDMIVLSDAINFLLVKDGTAVLRYST